MRDVLRLNCVCVCLPLLVACSTAPEEAQLGGTDALEEPGGAGPGTTSTSGSGNGDRGSNDEDSTGSGSETGFGDDEEPTGNEDPVGPCPEAAALTPVAVDLPGTVYDADAADLDGDGRLDLVLAGPDGVVRLRPTDCGGYDVADVLAVDAGVAGVAIGDLDGAGPLDVIAWAADLRLYALDGTDLSELWSGDLSGQGLADAGPTWAIRYDAGDDDHDALIADSGPCGYLRVENTGASWEVRASINPCGFFDVKAIAVGDVQTANPRDEQILVGADGTAIGVADPDFEISFLGLDTAASVSAVIGDFDGDGSEYDVVLGIEGGVAHAFPGDGTTFFLGPQGRALPAEIVDLAAGDLDHDGDDEAIALTAGGDVFVLDVSNVAVMVGDRDAATTAAARVFAGRIDADEREDVVTVSPEDGLEVWLSG